MPTTIVEELKTVVSADTDGFVKNMRKAENATAGFTKKELEAQKVLRSRASIVKDAFADPTRLAGGGLAKLTGSLNLSSKSAGILGAGIGTAAVAGSLLVKALMAGVRFAEEITSKTQALSEEMRRTSAVNVFSSSAEGVEALAGKIATIRAQMKQAKELRVEANPYGYGGGIVGNSMTMLAKVGQAKSDLLTEIPKGWRDAIGDAAKVLAPGIGHVLANGLKGVDQAGYSASDRERDAQKQLDGEDQVAAQQRAKLINQAADASSRELEITRLSIAGARTQVELTRSRVEYEKELARLRELGVTDPQVYRDLDERRSLNRRAIKLGRRGDYLGAVTANVVSTARPGMDQGLVRAQRAQMGLQAQFNTASQRPGGMFKQDRVEWQTRLQDANNLVRSERLSLQQRQDAVAAGKLDILNQRTLVDLGQQDFQARVRRADLDVQAAEQAKGQAFTIEQHIAAEDTLKKAVAARVNLEKISVTTQKQASDIAFRLASRNLDVGATNRSDLSKRAGINQNTLASLRAEMSLPGLSLDRQRELSLGIQGGENTRREQLQERLYGKSPAQAMKEMHSEQVEKLHRDQFDAKMQKTDGLFNVSRDINGNITSGIDYLTGEKRAPRIQQTGLSSEQATRVRQMRGGSPALAVPQGLQAGSLNGKATPTVAAIKKAVAGQNDQSAGKTSLDALRAIVAAINITNAYQKAAVEILPQLAFGS